MKNLLKYFLINTIYGLLLYGVFLILGFQLGYASNEKHLNETWVLFVLFIIFHVFSIVGWLFYKKEISIKSIIISLLTIVLLWGILAINGL